MLYVVAKCAAVVVGFFLLDWFGVAFILRE